MKWKNIKFAKKLSISFGIVISLFFANSLLAIIEIGNLLNYSDNINELENLKYEWSKKTRDQLNWALTIDEKILNEDSNWLNVELDPHKCSFGKWFYGDERKKFEESMPEIKELLIKIEEPHAYLHESAIKISSILKKGNNISTQNKDRERTQANKVFKEITSKHLKTIESLLEDINNISSERIKEIGEEINKKQKDVIIRIRIFTLSAIAIAIILTIIIIRGVVKPISKSVLFAKKVVAGDLTETIEIDQKDEIGEIIKALSSISKKVKEDITNIILSSDNIAKGSEQVSSTSQQLSQGVNEQATSIEEISSTMEEITANINQNTDNAQETEKIALLAQQGIIEVSKQSENTINATKKIAKKINIVTDIAFQTNILALNAAVEAARAGEHGKGFAVVAAEVRKLAQNSKTAADEIVLLVKKSLDSVVMVGEEIKMILPEVERTASLVQEIASASIEQNNGVNQINNAIQQLNNVIQQTAAASEELSANSEEVNSQTEEQKQMVSFYKIE
jgi:methyl-accepting chemotaxis protein